MPYAHAAMLLMLTGFLVGIFYSLDALHGERRERSILFWKSLPVSDLTTVLSKASIPLVILPVIVFVITVALQIVMRLVSARGPVAERCQRGDAVTPPIVRDAIGAALQPDRACALACAHLLLDAAGLWLGAARDISMGRVAATGDCRPRVHCVPHFVFGLLLKDRLFGFAASAFDLKDKNGVPIDAHFIPLAQLAPGRFLSSPSLWLGLIVAAICLAAAVRLRRYREPI